MIATRPPGLTHSGPALASFGSMAMRMAGGAPIAFVGSSAAPGMAAQETQAKELVKQVQEMQERLLRDPEAARALEELLKYFQAPPDDETTNH